MAPPPSVECYICGKMFGTHSIKIHERQCLKKWRVENDSLPPDMRTAEPQKKETNVATSNKRTTPERSPRGSVSSENKDRPQSARKAPMFPCYICGRLFTVNSIYIHEPQCLKMWKVENEKLPPHKRRPQPLKPDVKFTQEGKIDFEATTEANWQCHLSQLVPCKFCSRTFNPDRVDVHERSCKASGDVDFIGTFHRVWENHLAELIECRKCKRKFFPDRIETHEHACVGLGINVKNANRSSPNKKI